MPSPEPHPPAPAPAAASFATALELDLRHGRCVGVALPPAWDARATAALGELPAPARAFATELPPVRRLTFAGGRLALVRAAAQLGLAPGDLLAEPGGAPRVPAGAVGSVSHKATLAVALLDRADGWSRGVDLEICDVPRERIIGRVLTETEQRAVAGLPGDERWPAVLLRFSLKEALYKALHPHVRRYVAFAEAEMAPAAGGGCAVTLRLAGGEGPFDVDAAWLRAGDLVLTTCRVRSGAGR